MNTSKDRLFNALVLNEIACITDDKQLREESIEHLQMLLADMSQSTQVEVAEKIEAEAEERIQKNPEEKIKI